jgi:hypothetical protein
MSISSLHSFPISFNSSLILKCAPRWYREIVIHNTKPNKKFVDYDSDDYSTEAKSSDDSYANDKTKITDNRYFVDLVCDYVEDDDNDKNECENRDMQVKLKMEWKGQENIIKNKDSYYLL